MAQIVTITNPLTGQPAQVDQLEHTAQQIDDAIARTLPGGDIDTLLAGKAPAGYGLGGQSKFISSSDDLNDVVYDGWYYFDAPPINAPLLDGVNAVGYSSMLVSNRIPSLYVTQEIFCYTSLEAFNCVLRRCRINGEWKHWEWVNPPMMPGIEYRTTERYLGKPVYVKVIQAGFNPAGTVKTTSDKTVSASGLVRFSAVSGAWSFPSFLYGGNYADDGDIQVAVQATSDGINVFTWSKIRNMTSRTTNVSVYYTKD